MNKGAFSGAGRLALQGREEGSKTIVIVLTPGLIRMMVALGSLKADSKEYLTHVLHALLVPTHIAVPCHRGIVSNRPSGSQDFADELVIRLIGLNGLPDPLVEGVGVRAMTVIPALVSQDRCPFSGKKVCVAASFQ